MEGKRKEINTTALAFMGDAVYEIYVRRHVMESGQVNADRLHQMAVRYVRADGQAQAIKRMMRDNLLTEEETALVKRARNHRTTSKPRNADPVIYKPVTYTHLDVYKRQLQHRLRKSAEGYSGS